MNASIIIPTKNRTKLLEETISAIFDKQVYPTGKFEVIIVNDGNEELSAIQQKYNDVIVLKNTGSGAAWARNTGAKKALYDMLLFVDDDMLIPSGGVARHVELHKKYSNAIISGSWKYADNLVQMLKSTPFGRYKLENDYRSIQGEEINLKEPGVFNSSTLASFNLSILKKDFFEFGGYNTDFPYAGCEDQEFTMRALQNGMQLLLDTTNISLHNEKDRADMNKWLMRQYTGVQGYPLLCHLFPSKKKEPLYVENGLIRKGDSFNLKLKKTIKYFLSLSISLKLITIVTGIFESLKINDKALYRLYKGLCGLYIYKGFYLAEMQLKKI